MTGRVSVVVATYNGERWLDQQLTSIAEQERVPDEVVIADDGSSDGTTAVIGRFLSRRSDWRVLRTAGRLGPTANFQRGIRAARGDYIFLADQDDLWEPSKLSVLVPILEGSEHPIGVFSDGRIVDSSGRLTGATLWESLGVDQRERARLAAGDILPSLLRRNLVTGATVGFDARLLDLLLPFPAVGLHDAWIALVLSASERMAAVDRSLIRYRVHGANAIGLRPATAAGRVGQRIRRAGTAWEQATFFEAAVSRLESSPASQFARAAVAAKAEHQRRRADLPRAARDRLRVVWTSWCRGDYRRYSDRSMRSAVWDLVGGFLVRSEAPRQK